MTPPPEGTPWWVWLLAIVAVQAAGLVATLITRRDTKSELKDAKAAAALATHMSAQTLDQVQNTHTVNLRADLDEKFDGLRAEFAGIRTDLGAVREDIGGLHSETRSLRDDMGGLRADSRRDRTQVAATRASLDEHLDQIPDILGRAFAEHCPKNHPDQP